jgi:thiamine-phosphate pyrophosphorylase
VRPLPPALRLLAITDRKLCGGEQALLARCCQLLDLGVRAFMLREKDLPNAELLRLAEQLRAPIKSAGGILLINSAIDVAAGCAADGAHLGSTAPDFASARAALGPEALLGASCHNDAEIARAEAAGADYILLSPLFGPRSKPSAAPPLGLEEFSRLARSTPLPVLALGGIDEESADKALAAGAFGVAAISLFMLPTAESDEWIKAASQRRIEQGRSA